MRSQDFDVISREMLQQYTDREPPDNMSASGGYALVNVLGEEAFRKEHIPASINIPKGQEDEFERRFARDKHIIVYCASPECDASPKVAGELASRGFENVHDYEGGMKDWKASGAQVASGA